MASKQSRTPRSGEVYRKAAAMLFLPLQKRCWGCCDVINQVAKGDPVAGSSEHRQFERLFSPHGVASFCYWGQHWSDSGSEFDSTAHGCRVLALCFMAAMVEAGDA